MNAQRRRNRAIEAIFWDAPADFATWDNARTKRWLRSVGCSAVEIAEAERLGCGLLDLVDHLRSRAADRVVEVARSERRTEGGHGRGDEDGRHVHREAEKVRK